MRRAKPREKTPSKPTIEPLPWQEWDFREHILKKIGRIETVLGTCLDYEILRFLYLDPTFDCCRREVDLWRSSEPALNTDFSAFALHDEFPKTPWIFFSEWPETSFLKLSKERQLAAIELSKNHNKAESLRLAKKTAEDRQAKDPEAFELWRRAGVSGSNAPMQTPIRQCDPELYRDAKWIGDRNEIEGPHYTIAAFHFDWSRNNSDILREMEGWLTSARKRFCEAMAPDNHLKSDLENGLETRGNHSTSSLLADLNALGAYRLSRHHKGDATSLKWLTAHLGLNDPIDSADWSRRMSRGRYLIYQESLNWISSEEDRVWSDGKVHRYKDFCRDLWPSDIKEMESYAEEVITEKTASTDSD